MPTYMYIYSVYRINQVILSFALLIAKVCNKQYANIEHTMAALCIISKLKGFIF